MVVNSKRQNELKPLGVLLQNDREHFSVRLLSRAGNFTAEDIINIAHLSKKYGQGYVGETTRLQIEIPWIKDEDVEEFLKEAETLGLKHGGTGPKVRPLVSCKGTICIHGNIDTQSITRKLEDKYFGMKTPHKCKIGVNGCVNNCAKATMSDIGITGITEPQINRNKCVGCGLCVDVCKPKALEIINKKVVQNKTLCVSCGDCVRTCKFEAITIKEKGAEIFIGGMLGRNIKNGISLGVFKEEEILSVVDSIIKYYMEFGKDNERISYVMDRIGENRVINTILKDITKNS